MSFFLNLMTLCYRSPRHYIPGVSALWVDDRMLGYIFSLSIFLLKSLDFQSPPFSVFQYEKFHFETAPT